MVNMTFFVDRLNQWDDQQQVDIMKPECYIMLYIILCLAVSFKNQGRDSHVTTRFI